MEEMTAANAFVLFLTTEPVSRNTRFQSQEDYEELQEWDQSVELIKKALTKKPGRLIP